MCADVTNPAADEAGAGSGYLRRLTDVRERLVDKIVAAALTAPSPDVSVDVAAFIRQYYRNVAAEDLRERSAVNLAGLALSHLAFAAEREPGTTRVRLFHPEAQRDGWDSLHTIVQMVNDDMPFLVDSLGMALNRHRMAAHVTVHPVLRVRRDDRGHLTAVLAPDAAEGHSESLVAVEVDRVTDPAVLAEVQGAIEAAINDVRKTTRDWREMRSRVIDVVHDLQAHPPPLAADVVTESTSLLQWMADDHFTFLGYREYSLVREDGAERLEALGETGLGILAADGPAEGGDGPAHDRSSIHERHQDPAMARAIRRQIRSPDLLLITKANSLATVHRPAYLDYVGVKTFDDAGRVVGEKRFLGLFTSVAYNRRPSSIPLLRHKVAQVMDRSGLGYTSHAGKGLMHILETFPRDELFQISVDDLSRISAGILSLQERQRVKLFVRRDAFRRFVSCLVFIPRDKYNTQVRERVEGILQNGFGGSSVESMVYLSESNLARVHVIVRTPPTDATRLPARSVERMIADVVRTWADRLRDAMRARFGEERGIGLYNRYVGCFPAAYQEDISPRAAAHDIETLTTLGDDPEELRISVYRPPSRAENQLRLKVFHRNEAIPLSDVMPMLERMGLRVLSTRPYRLDLGTGGIVWVQDFEVVFYIDQRLDPSKISDILQDTFTQVWRGRAENDRFNRLVLLQRLTCRETTLLRAICKYLLQTGLPFSQAYIMETLSEYSTVAALLARLFEARFHPGYNERRRQRRLLSVAQELDDALDKVATLDGDRILRAFLAVIRAMLRTNFYQRGADGRLRDYLSFKLDPERIPELPLPLPMFEIFVYAPWVEGVHLRAGTVARGGLRWSDRREDFRTEVLGLMKAQTVKNTVIVPAGAKGGFVLKPAPAGTADEVRRTVERGYRDFLRGLLDITDNIVDGEVQPPREVVRYDRDDPYLVVAADKGTATFSDIANEVAESYGFWLGDAFASGGSAGYDHKGMGITAKGAWEAVRRHFREFGLDTQAEEFTVAGIGDMSGDVFGNGMLLSPHIRLLAAFNHQHIFLDPDPDPRRSYAERERLFALPRSTWLDYDRSLISEGGGVYSRADKSILLSPEARRCLDVRAERMTPQELIRAILTSPVDLLWNGGIGTYVKAGAESHGDVGDRANDAVRVNADRLRCKVVGEGGNLGLTQLARVEAALRGVRLNTDFIDNSAGVDCSDHEVNIKILLNTADRRQPMSRRERDALLEQMTGEVEQLVLRNNYLQTQAISMIETTAPNRFPEHVHLVRRLQRAGEMDPALQFLPDQEGVRERARAGLGYTRPELAIILSYAKISLYRQLCDSNIADDPGLSRKLGQYFPEPLRERYAQAMAEHRLRKDIIAMQTTNSIVNRMGPTFAARIQEDLGVDVCSLARAYIVAREAFAMQATWTGIEALDNDLPASAQYAMMIQTARLLRRATLWLLNRCADSLDVAAAVAKFQPGIALIDERLPELLVDAELGRYEESATAYTDIGVPAPLARRMAGLQPLYAALDILDVAERCGADGCDVATIYFRVSAGLKLDWLREQAERLAVEGRWQAMARTTLRDNLNELNRALTAQVIRDAGGVASAQAVSSWIAAHVDRVQRAQRTLEEMRAEGTLDFPTLSVAVHEIRKLTQV